MRKNLNLAPNGMEIASQSQQVITLKEVMNDELIYMDQAAINFHYIYQALHRQRGV